MRRIFASEIMGGFECSTHVNRRRRVDVIAATKHDRFAEKDYRRLLDIGIKTARDGARWHLIEREPFRYDFSSVANQVRAARETGIEIIWDLFHYGFPDDVDLLSAQFVERLAAFAEAFAEFLISEDGRNLFICPLNEISFFSWIAGSVGGFHPFLIGRGEEVKRNLVRAEIAATDAVRKVCPTARFIHTDPAINITSAQKTPGQIEAARRRSTAQFQALDMLTGRRKSNLGGAPEYLDIIGLNYYYNNQWRYRSGRKVFRGHPDYRPFSDILVEYWRRYRRPILIAETGIEDEARAEWFRYVCSEVEIAKSLGAQIEGVCLYPIVNHPGWDDDRHCHNGLWDYADEAGNREIYEPLAVEVRKEIERQNLGEKTFEKFAFRAQAGVA
jgi:beta-glucosidase/6-phospho-beta-glucosidase/beta-galactosidase